VIVGVGQVSQRVDRGEPALEPVDLMVEALHRAEGDAGAKVLAGADSVRVLRQLSFRYGDPGALVAQRVGATPAETVYTVMGGNYVQTVVNRTAGEIAAGERDLVLLCGAEAWRTRSEAKRAGHRPEWTTQAEGTAPTVMIGESDPDMGHPAEMAQGITLPIQFYPMVELALRASRAESPDAHRTRIAELWSRFSSVAASNPYAWVQEEYAPAEIREPSPDNRMIGFPYTKRMNSNNAVEQGAALVMCSAAKAQELGIAADRQVFVHAGTDAHDHWFASNRDELHRSPAMRIAGRRALDLAGVTADDLAFVDLYSCFPSAVQVAAHELGLGLDRQLTVTGGMSFAGGPWNNYVMHAVATTVGLLRDNPRERGLCTANGGYLTKHSFGVYGAEPPSSGYFRHAEPQSEVDALPRRDVITDYEGTVEIEAYTVMHDRDGRPDTAPIAMLTPTGERTWGTCNHPDTLSTMTEQEFVGRAADRRAEGAVTVQD
jgi:acetyl-CoA C-acetyltransferase